MGRERILAFPHLSPEQATIVASVKRYFADAARANEPKEDEWGRVANVVAIAGARGVGKTTVLKELRRVIGDLAHDPWVVCTTIIDAATLRRDLGIAAAAIEALRETVPLNGAVGIKLPGAGPLRVHGVAQERLEAAHRKCLEAALTLEESHRELAQDLAMSLSHYASTVKQGYDRKRAMPDTFREFLQALVEAHVALASSDGRPRPRRPHIVVFIDDLDLAEASLVRSFTQSVLVDYCAPEVHWVLAFDRYRMVRALSQSRIGYRTPDIETGNALLTKLAPFHQLHELFGWNYAGRRAFAPLLPERDPGRADADDRRTRASGGARPQNLGTLLVSVGREDMFPLLASRPRSLEGVYQRLLAWSREGGEKGGKVMPAEEFISFTLRAAGEASLSDLVRRMTPTRFAARLEWNGKAALDKGEWADLASSSLDDEPIWGFPIPSSLRRLAGSLDPESVLEAILDLALADPLTSPHSVLASMPFVREQVDLARVDTAYSEAEILHYLDAPSLGAAYALEWQGWMSTPESGMWRVILGPNALWQAHYGLRSPVPSSMLKQLYVPQMAFAQSRSGMPTASTKEDPLPRKLRSLVRLVAGLARVPWRQLESVEKLWSPLAMAQAVAAMTLSAYAWGIWDSETAPVGHALDVAHSGSVDALLRMTQGEIETSYGSFCDALRSISVPSGHPGPGLLARLELHRALQAMLALPAVSALAQAAQGPAPL